MENRFRSTIKISDVSGDGVSTFASGDAGRAIFIIVGTEKPEQVVAITANCSASILKQQTVVAGPAIADCACVHFDGIVPLSAVGF